jgi:tetratricopeptide (TPR) repeat protein
MAALYLADNRKDSAMSYLEKALPFMTDSTTRLDYYRKLADFAKSVKNYSMQAKWLARYYTENSRANNLNLFNWGLAAFLAKDYQQADSVFGLYANKYPDQSFGYYWRARANAAIDTSMSAGLAVPYYEKLIAVIGEDSLSETDKKWKIEAYGYLAAYETNTEKDFEEAIAYFQKLLQIDPENSQAKQYLALLEKNIRKEKTGDKSNPDKN